MVSFPQILVDNPVARAELSHQAQNAETRKWRRWPVLFGIGLGAAVVSSAGLLFAPLISRVINFPAQNITEIMYSWFGTVTVLLGALIMIHHLSFASAAVQLASTSIAREKSGLTWESLLLTGVDARKIVYGKWWATVRTLWRAYRPLLVLRFACALWMGVFAGQSPMGRISEMLPLPEMLLISTATAVFPLFYAAFSSAIGMIASLLARQEVTAYRIASLFQFGAIVLSLSMILASFMIPFIDLDPALVTIIPALFVTPLDGGMLALIGMVANSDASAFYYVLGVALCMALYAALAWALLQVAQALAVHQRALPPRR